MPKERRTPFSASNRTSSAPYPCASNDAKHLGPKNLHESPENIREWDEAQCPVCMEHPHNAVLLICSSQEKGCRPYMCNTSHRHSNCLDQFHKSATPSPSSAVLQEAPSTATVSHGRIVEQLNSRRTPAAPCGSSIESNLVCPFCRGQIYGWVVVEAARQYMNSKSRSCSSENCEFSGTYSELRKHARLVHPANRPTEVDPSRQRDWTRFQRERELEDFRSTLQSALGGADGEIIGDDGNENELSFSEVDENEFGMHFMWSYMSSALFLAEVILDSFRYSRPHIARGRGQPRNELSVRRPRRAPRRDIYMSDDGRRVHRRYHWRDSRWSPSGAR